MAKWLWSRRNKDLPCQHCNYKTAGRVDGQPVCKICFEGALYQCEKAGGQ